MFDSSNTFVGTRQASVRGLFGSSLTISDLEMNDSGNYSCVAQNMYGSEEITYFIEVKCELSLSYIFFWIIPLINFIQKFEDI